MAILLEDSSGCCWPQHRIALLPGGPRGEARSSPARYIARNFTERDGVKARYGGLPVTWLSPSRDVWWTSPDWSVCEFDLNGTADPAFQAGGRLRDRRGADGGRTCSARGERRADLAPCWSSRWRCGS